MMTVRHISAGHLALKQAGERHAQAHADPPELMPHAINGGEVIDRLLRLHEALNQGADAWTLAVGEEDRAGVGIECVHEVRAVVFFVLPGLLVLLDDVLLVILRVADGDEAGLAVTGDDLTVEIHRGFGLTHQNPLRLQPVEILACLRIHRCGIGIDFRIEIDLGAVHMQQAERLALGKGGGLLAVHHVVRNGGDLGGVFLSGDETFERADAHGAG